MNQKQQVANYIRSKKHLLEKQDLDTLYEECAYVVRPIVTELFLEMGINPLLYVSKVPEGFAFQLDITHIDIPNGITRIGSGAFDGCNKLTSIDIPNSVTSIGDGAFFECEELTNITIPNGVTTIGPSTFEYCGKLNRVEIPNSVNVIGKNAFYECIGLTGIHVTDLTKWCDINFEGDYANPLYYASKLYLNGNPVTELEIPNGVTKLNNYAFYGYGGLISVKLPDSVTHIGDEAFYVCYNLTSIELSNSVKSIGWYAFSECDNLTSITFHGTIEEWNNIDKGRHWDSNTGHYTIHCTDGDIHKGEF